MLIHFASWAAHAHTHLHTHTLAYQTISIDFANIKRRSHKLAASLNSLAQTYASMLDRVYIDTL